MLIKIEPDQLLYNTIHTDFFSFKHSFNICSHGDDELQIVNKALLALSVSLSICCCSNT